LEEQEPKAERVQFSGSKDPDGELAKVTCPEVEVWGVISAVQVVDNPSSYSLGEHESIRAVLTADPVKVVRVVVVDVVELEKVVVEVVVVTEEVAVAVR
jgi:hypothetical protein